MPSNIKIAKSTVHGRGIFATNDLSKDDVLCACPIILVSITDPSNSGSLGAYYFEWSTTNHALILGPISLANHSKTPNAAIYTNQKTKTAQMLALRKIKKGDEILINYGKDYEYAYFN
jgi:SET domain-containing protein